MRSPTRSLARLARFLLPYRWRVAGMLVSLVLATGGLSIPKMGATSFGYDLARQFNLKIQTPRPALVPLAWNEFDCKRWCDLAGVSTEVIASVSGNKQTFREKMLFTHRGISGPAIPARRCGA